MYSTVKHEILNSACFGSIQARKRLFVVASNADVALPTPGEPKGIPLASFLDDAAQPMLNAKAVAYLHRRKKWGVKIYRREFVGHVGTIPRSYGHQVSWKHVIEEEEGNLRNLTANEAFRIMGYDPSKLVFGKLSKRQRFYLAGNAIELNVLIQLLKQLLPGSKEAKKTKWLVTHSIAILTHHGMPNLMGIGCVNVVTKLLRRNGQYQTRYIV